MDTTSLSKLASGAVALEAGALALLWSPDPAMYWAFWAGHAAAAAPTALLGWKLLPPPLQRPKRWSLALAYTVALMMPVLGVVGVVLAAWLAHALPARVRRRDHLREAPTLEVFAISLDIEQRPDELPAGQVARMARDPGRARAQRIRAVLALREMAPRVAVPTLRALLADPDEEIRLLAYSIVEVWERELTAKLQAALRELQALRAQGAHGPVLSRAAQQVAELQLEFVYQGLAQGDLRDFTMDQARTYCRIALEATPEEPSLLMMHLRLSLAQGAHGEARDMLLRLRATDASPTMWRPYAAELAWQERRYQDVREVLRPMHADQVAPRLRPVVRVWARPQRGEPRVSRPAPLSDARPLSDITEALV
ncbi:MULTISPECIES: hypothetical protein [Caldimonas]|uniref:tetratricopeptide repeat protein n=1 Tax=Caldimonas TaxID=196013 RepID=UPI00035F8BE1|nr:hypothetical protein [Caldimonas manganoxidans]